jgi:hypothetical protein
MKITLLLIAIFMLLTATAIAEDTADNADKNKENGESEGVLIIKTVPKQADVYIRSSSRETVVSSGKTPLKKLLPPGSYKIKLSHENYETGKTKVEIKPGKETLLHIKLTPEVPGYHTLRILGHSFLWPGVATTITGVVLTAVDPRGTAGKVGFALLGVGLALDLTGVICLGIAYKKMSKSIQVSFAPLPDGAAVFYGRSF